jgi:hypothetical protein
LGRKIEVGGVRQALMGDALLGSGRAQLGQKCGWFRAGRDGESLTGSEYSQPSRLKLVGDGGCGIYRGINLFDSVGTGGSCIRV